MNAASWVICEKATGRAVLETFSPRLIEKLNNAKYEAIPIMAYLQNLNKLIKAGTL